MVSLPGMPKRQLGRSLRDLRLKARKTQDDVVEAGICARSTLSLIENGTSKNRIKITTVAGLLDLYGVPPGVLRDELKRQARQTGQKEESVRMLEAGYAQSLHQLLELEQLASSISEHNETLISGYFQTKSYMQALVQHVIDSPDPQIRKLDIEEMVEARVDRAEKVRQRLDHGLRLNFLVNFAALEVQVGGIKTMREQRDFLAHWSEHPSVSISVVPPSAGAYPCIQRRFIILEFDNPMDPTTIFEESSHSPRYRDASEYENFVSRYRHLFDESCRISLTIKEYLSEH
jgi:transcriptional regulator with XRE-family HTH domain